MIWLNTQNYDQKKNNNSSARSLLSQGFTALKNIKFVHLINELWGQQPILVESNQNEKRGEIAETLECLVWSLMKFPSGSSCVELSESGNKLQSD